MRRLTVHKNRLAATCLGVGTHYTAKLTTLRQPVSLAGLNGSRFEEGTGDRGGREGCDRVEMVKTRRGG